jgi:hypothetical protein
MGETADIQDSQEGPSDRDGLTLSRRIQELKEAIEHQSQMGMTEYVLLVLFCMNISDRLPIKEIDGQLTRFSTSSRHRAKQLTASHIAALDKVRSSFPLRFLLGRTHPPYWVTGLMLF